VGILVVKDIRAYYNVMRIANDIKSRDYLKTLMQKYSPPKIVVAKEDAPIVVTKGDSKRKAYYKFILAFMDKTRFDRVRVGVDPGKNIGVAVIADGHLIDLDLLHRIYDLINLVKDLMDIAEKVVVKIGNGGNSQHIISELKMAFNRNESNRYLGSLNIICVNEYDASSVPYYWLRFRRRYEDMVSALQIALKYVPEEGL